jgi:hypothetical protein
MVVTEASSSFRIVRGLNRSGDTLMHSRSSSMARKLEVLQSTCRAESETLEEPVIGLLILNDKISRWTARGSTRSERVPHGWSGPAPRKVEAKEGRSRRKHGAMGNGPLQ